MLHEAFYISMSLAQPQTAAINADSEYDIPVSLDFAEPNHHKCSSRNDLWLEIWQ